MTVLTVDGVVHLPAKGKLLAGGATTHCGLRDRTWAAADRPSCPTCKTTDICPKCDQRVETEVIRGRYRTVTATKAHIRPKGASVTVCHAILKEEGR